MAEPTHRFSYRGMASHDGMARHDGLMLSRRVFDASFMAGSEAFDSLLQPFGASAPRLARNNFVLVDSDTNAARAERRQGCPFDAGDRRPRRWGNRYTRGGVVRTIAQEREIVGVTHGELTVRLGCVAVEDV